MNKIYKENPQTGEIKEFDDINNFGMEHTNWITPTQAKIDAYNLSQAKTKAESILTTERKQKQYNSITYNGKNYWGSQTAQNNIGWATFKAFKDILKQKGLVTEAELKAVVSSWSTTDRSKVELTGFDNDGMFDEIFAKSRELYLEEDEKQIKVKDAVNVSQIGAVLQPGTSLQSGSGGGELSQVQNLQPGTGL